MSFVLTFDNATALEKSRSGGKGASLASLTKAGFQVPRGLILTADAYRLFASGIDAGPAQVLKTLESRALPADIEAAVRIAMQDLGETMPVAVRSSSTLEDLAEAAFAGQHETYLNCVGIDAVLNAVRKCYLSLWQERAVVYREKQGFRHSDAAMAVVIQTMVQADVAGVGFTIDPIGGRLDHMVANASWGLGERVVSGEGEVDQFTFDKKTGAILARTLGHKAARIEAAGQGVREVELAAEQAATACLSDTALAALAGLMARVESHYGFPQDIEWALAGDELYLLQARPVTHIPERWTRDESAERFPNPVTPLTWDFVDSAFHRALAHSFQLMGLPPMTGKWFARFDNYIYGNQNAVALYLKPPALPLHDLAALKAALPALIKRYDWLLRLPKQWKQGLDDYLIALGALKAVELNTLSDSELWAHIKRINALGSDYFRTNIAISIGQASLYGGLQLILKAIAGDDAAPALFDGLTAYAETKTAAVNEELYALAQEVAVDPALKDAIQNQPSQRFLSGGGLRHYPVVREAFQDFLSRHGHRETDFDPYHPTWCDAPHVVMDNIKAILAAGSGVTPAERARLAKDKAKAARTAFLGHIPADMHGFFEELLELTRTFTELDDIEHYQTSRLTPVLRNAVQALGERFRARGWIEHPMDLFFAHADTIEAAVGDGGPALVRLTTEINDNIAAHAAALERQPRWVLDEETEATPDQAEGQLKGTPGSAGTAEGTVYLVRSPDDFAHFPKGAILVAATTNPAWTPLFYAAKAVITESGGPLSHGAVTAREVGIPAVMSVRQVMATLSNGQSVRVNGKTGYIELL